MYAVLQHEDTFGTFSSRRLERSQSVARYGYRRRMSDPHHGRRPNSWQRRFPMTSSPDLTTSWEPRRCKLELRPLFKDPHSGLHRR